MINAERGVFRAKKHLKYVTFKIAQLGKVLIVRETFPIK